MVAAGLLVVSPVGSVVARGDDPPPTTSDLAPLKEDPSTSAAAPTPTASEPATTGATTPPTTPADSTVAPTTANAPAATTTSPNAPTTTSTTPETTSTTPAPQALDVSAILQAPNPFDATQGFTLLARDGAQLRGGTTVGAVAVGGDVSFGDYTVTPTPAATLDDRPIGLLVGGTLAMGSSTGRLEVAANGQLLLGNVDQLSAQPADGGLAVVPGGASELSDPQVRVAGPQDVASVASPGTFERAFSSVFADLASRSQTFAQLSPNVMATADDGAPLDAHTGSDVHLTAGDDPGSGPYVWNVTADDLAAIGHVIVDLSPTAERPLVINVDGGGSPVRLDTAVQIDEATRAHVVWNLAATGAVTIASPLPGSLLAPDAAVELAADVHGQVVAGSVDQTAGTVGAAPFAGELPKTGDPVASPDETTTTTPTAPVDPLGQLPRAVPLVVPPATGNNAVITVKVGGVRTGVNAIGGLAGVVLQLYDGDANGPTTPVAGAFATCTSDADGDCSFTVPNTQNDGANHNKRYWIQRTSTPAGYFGLNSLNTGTTGSTATPYRFRTGDQLQNGTVYSSLDDFMIGTGNTNAVASGGIWQSSRNNPTLSPACGLDVALILDVSGSVAPNLADLKTAAKTFVNATVGTPSQFGLFTFASTAPANTTNNQNRPLSPTSTQTGANVVNGWIDGLSASGGTNWDRGISQVAESGSSFDVAVIITDGNPTFYGNQEGPGNFTRFREIENGIFSANAVKAKGTRMIAVGVGAGVSGGGPNLQSISGQTLNSDYFQTSDYTAAGNALRALALGSCNGAVSVVKQVVPSTAPVGSITGATPAGGWTFGATTTAAGVGITPASGATAAGTGALSFNLTYPGGTTTAPVTVNETQQAGYTLQQVGGFNATCTRLDTGAALTVTNSGTTGFIVNVASTVPVSCTVYNRAPNPAATVVVNKTWVINGADVRRGRATHERAGGAHDRRDPARLGRRSDGQAARADRDDQRDDHHAAEPVHVGQ